MRNDTMHQSAQFICSLLAVAALSVFCGKAFGLSAGLDHWNLRNPTRMPYQLWSVCYGNGTFVAGGYAGTLLSSSDGINWQTRNFNPTNLVTCLAYVNNRFLASFNTGEMMTSSDGVVWESWPVNIESLYEIVYGKGMYLGIDFYGNVYVSLDGHTWEQQPYCRCDLDSHTVFAMDRFVFPCGSELFTSTNGTDWPSTQYNSSRMRAATYGNGLFVAVGNDSAMFTSYDGYAWSRQSAGPLVYFGDVIYGNGKFITYSGAKTLTSTNGTNWSLALLPVNQNDSTAMVAGDGKFVTVCGSSKILFSTNGTVWESHDNSSTEYSLGGIAYGNGVFCTGSGLVSKDALNWQAANRPFGSSAILFAAGRFVSVGPGIWTSVDGTNWSNPVPRQLTGIYSVSYGNNLFVAAGVETFTSTNGLDWSLCSNAVHANAVTFGNGMFAALSGRQVYTSTNGTLWVAHSIPAPDQLNDITSGAGVFLVVGDFGTMIISSNAIDWVQLEPATFQRKSLKAITYAQGTFVCVGNSGAIFTSTNGLAWQKRQSGTVLEFHGVCYGDETFVVTGQNGLIMECDPFSDLDIIRGTDTAMRLQIFCESPEGCWLETSPDLENWGKVGTNKIHQGVSEFALEPNSPRRYFRLK